MIRQIQLRLREPRSAISAPWHEAMFVSSFIAMDSARVRLLEKGVAVNYGRRTSKVQHNACPVGSVPSVIFWNRWRKEWTCLWGRSRLVILWTCSWELFWENSQSRRRCSWELESESSNFNRGHVVCSEALRPVGTQNQLKKYIQADIPLQTCFIILIRR